jgi:hypothetical protein
MVASAISLTLYNQTFPFLSNFGNVSQPDYLHHFFDTRFDRRPNTIASIVRLFVCSWHWL